MSDVLLRLEGVRKSYGEGETAVNVLKGADLSVSRGELIALVAPSGAGKSTLLHISGLLERPSSGDVTINGQSTSALTDRQCTLLRRHRIGYVYQFHHLLPEFSAIENVSMPQLILGKDNTDARARGMELLELMGIAHRSTHRPAELSGGEQQRVAIARAAANRPSLILADEPTGNLDPATSNKVFLALRDIIARHQSSCIIATHNHDLAKRADRVVTITEGVVEPLAL